MAQEKHNHRDSLAQIPVLVTGGAGFIGSNISRYLLSLGAKVTVIDSLNPRTGANLKNIEKIKNDIFFMQQNVLHWENLKHSLKNTQYLFNCMGQACHQTGLHDPCFDLECNLTAQISILEACRRFNPDIKIVHLSSRHVYGRPKFLPVRETHPISPIDTYGIHKSAAEMHYKLYEQNFGIATVILRLTNIFGPCQNKTDVAGVFFRKAVKKETLTIYGEGDQLRDFLYVDDVAHASIFAAFLPKGDSNTYNISGDARISLTDFALKIAAETGCDIQHVPFPKEIKMVETGDIYLDHSLFTARTGWQPHVSLQEGIKDAVLFFRSNEG